MRACYFLLSLTTLAVLTLSSNGDEVVEDDEFIKFVGEKTYYVPFKTRISEPFKESQTVHAVGKITEFPRRIDLNFHKIGASSDEEEIPMHLSVRFDEGLFSGKIVFNTFANGNWSPVEERAPSPFKANKDLDIRVRITEGEFIIYGDRQIVGKFAQRSPIDNVSHVSVTGDLENLRVFHYGGTKFPNPYNAIARLQPGKRLDISAIPTGNRVNVNLYKAGQKFVFHISIRFDEGAIVRNAMEDGNWGKEERDGGFPLSRNEIFDLTIVNKDYGYFIYINGKKFTVFEHRGANTEIETLEIDGSVELITVTIN